MSSDQYQMTSRTSGNVLAISGS